MNNQNHLNETELASKIATQTQKNKLARIVFAGHFNNLLNTINFNKQIEDMDRFYPREYIDGVLMQIN